MKKFITIIVGLIALQMGSESCTPKTAGIADKHFKARFEIAGMCSNYTFTLIDGKMDPSKLEASWTDPQTKKVYKNAFGIGNPCDFPNTLKVGDIFTFVIDTGTIKDCAVCMAYYPTPEKRLNIKVIP